FTRKMFGASIKQVDFVLRQVVQLPEIIKPGGNRVKKTRGSEISRRRAPMRILPPSPSLAINHSTKNQPAARICQ
ncbi:MAG TPA: hypothetical protein VGB68_02605, partial [Pyrinomonadaceae bacterium]